jgi:monoamine oxidase
MPKVLIIGAGLSGLSTAYALRNANIDLTLLEARPRLGGRIFTRKENHLHLEMGATWFGPQHSKLIALVNELKVLYKVQENGREAIYDFRPKGNLERFQIPSQGASTYKFKEGSSALINALHQQISASVVYNEVVNTISFDKIFKIKTNTSQFEADYVILSIPPQLIKDSIQFEPCLPSSFEQLLSNTHTWMSDSIKFSAAFDSEFWKTEQFIGTLMSPQQIIQEMYDHSDRDNSQRALVGFLNSSYSNITGEQRKVQFLNQLQSIFPNKRLEPRAYAEVNWRNEQFTIHKNAEALVPHQNNGNPKLRAGFFNNKLFFSASETAAQTPGYMDGAVHRGLEVGELIKNRLA